MLMVKLLKKEKTYTSLGKNGVIVLIFLIDSGRDRSDGEEGDWIKSSALHSTIHGENYFNQYIKREGHMRVKKYRK